MASSAKQSRSVTDFIKEVLARVLDKESDPEGMSSSKESELDRQLENPCEESR